jgi:GLPGLI family protein
VVDFCTIRVYYALNAVDIKDLKTYDDLGRLDIGSNFSKYYSYFVYARDSLTNDFIKKNPNAGSFPTWLGERGKITIWSILIWSDFLKDFTENTLTEYANMPHLMPNHQYTEKMPIQRWQLFNETTTIAGHLCRKATCRFRGRNFVAWYAPDIPH